MGKGRKLNSSSRFLGTTFTQPSTITITITGSEEFREEDMWSTAEHRDHHRHVGGLSLTFEDPRRSNGTANMHHHHMSTSAPVNVPDWTKILRVDSVESLHGMDDGIDDDDDDDDGSEMVPPHEYLARKKAAKSVFEGVGRTLKGRDLSRVRDAVWSQTGFDG